MATRTIFKHLVDVLTVGEADRTPPWGCLTEDDVADELLATALPKRAKTTSPGMAQEPSNDETRFPASLRNISRSSRGLAGQARAGEGKDNDLQQGEKTAAATSHQDSIPG